VGTPENAHVRARILAAFAALGMEARVQSGVSCDGRERYGFVVCATVHNIVAEVTPGQGKSIVLLAHYDSVGAGPGASDDGSSVAAILETARALKARHVTRHPVMAVITDGEEAGLLGASFFLRDPALKDRVGVVINAEARGTNGPSLLFQTSSGNAGLIAVYARHVSHYASSSLFAEIYKSLPNDTDLSRFLEQGLAGVNFAFIGDVAYYHTSQDRRIHLDRATLQHHGENLLGMAVGLQDADLAALKGGDSVYLSLFGRWLLRLPQGWQPYLAALSFLIVLAASRLRRNPPRRRRLVLGIGVVVMTLAGAMAAGFALHGLASSVMGVSDPSFAHPLPLRFALTCAVLGVAVLCARLIDGATLVLSVWLFLSGIAVVAAILLPGAAPYALFPVLAAAPLMLLQARLEGMMGQALLLTAAVPAVLIWMSLAALGEDVAGLRLHPLFTLPVAGIALVLMPVVGVPFLSRGCWLRLSGVLVAGAVGLAAYAGMQSPFSATRPQRLNIAFIDDHIGGKATWAADTRSTLPAGLRHAAAFSAQPVQFPLIMPSAAYAAPAGPLRFQPPRVTAEDVPEGAGWNVSLSWPQESRAQESAPQGSYQDITLDVPAGAGLKSITVNGQSFAAAADGSAVIRCGVAACAAKPVILTFVEKRPVDITVVARRFGLPPDGEAIARHRGDTAVPLHAGDVTLVVSALSLH
jgi:hypothetical protein